MQNIQFTSQETDLKILGPLALLAPSAVAGVFVGLFMPVGYGGIHGASWILAVISVGLALFTWSLFRLIKPVCYDRQWQTAEMILVPLYSLTLTLVAGLCIAWLIQLSIQEMSDLIPQYRSLL